MLKISELLGRFKNIGLGERLSKEALVEEINRVTGLNTVSIKDISIKNQTAFVKAGSALKSEITLYKRSILNRAKERVGTNFVVKDIR